MLWFRLPPKVYHKYGCLPTALKELEGKKRAFIVTDSFLFNSGCADRVTRSLKPMGIETECFHQVKPDPTLSTINDGLAIMNSFNPDVIIGLGGGSPMDAAKIMWLLYEHPEVHFEGLAMRFNATDNPLKQAAFPQYEYPTAISRYARVADYLGLGGKSDMDKIENLMKKIDELKKELNIPATIKEYGIDEKEFLARLDVLAEQAFDDQCTGANPRYPLIREIKQMYLNAFYGKLYALNKDEKTSAAS